MYSAVLLPTDGSTGMASAIRHALHQAETHDATLHALYVVDVRAFVVLPDETRDQVRDILIETGEAAVDLVERLADERDVDVVTGIYEGVPAETIVEYAASEAMDVIVMGTHGQTGDETRVVGSVAEEVVRKATVPVLTVRTDPSDAEAFADELPVTPRYIE